jgi:hypothetical protein
MDLLKKIETLVSATARSKLPRRGRRSILDEQEEKLLAEIRQAVANVQAQERVLAKRLKSERSQAEEAGQQGNRDEQRIHERRAEELGRQLEQESIQAIDLEEKLAALEEKLALAREAVEKQAQEAVDKAAEADAILAEGEAAQVEARTEAIIKSTAEKTTPADSADESRDLTSRKSRLSE